MEKKYISKMGLLKINYENKIKFLKTGLHLLTKKQRKSAKIMIGTYHEAISDMQVFEKITKNKFNKREEPMRRKNKSRLKKKSSA